MNINSIGEIYSYLLGDRMSLAYAGSFKDAVTTKAIKLSEHNIDKSEGLASLKKKSSFLMAECFQNVVRHNEGEKFSQYHPAEQGFFLTRSRGQMYYIASSNIVDQDIVGELKEKLTHINELDKDELKSLYIDVLKNRGLSEKGGAGLGLIEMARKSGNPLSFDFKKMAEDHSLFYLLIQMNSGIDSSESDNMELRHVEEIHQIMIDNDILLIYKGDFSQQSISPIINMLETNLKSHDIEYLENKKIFVTLVEMIQNITDHSLEIEGVKPGILAISGNNNHFQLGSGNYMKSDDRDKIASVVKKLNGMSSEELRSAYKEALFKTTKEEYKAELGLIDIARASKKDLQYAVVDNIGPHPFFSFMVDM